MTRNGIPMSPALLLSLVLAAGVTTACFDAGPEDGQETLADSPDDEATAPTDEGQDEAGATPAPSEKLRKTRCCVGIWHGSPPGILCFQWKKTYIVAAAKCSIGTLFNPDLAGVSETNMFTGECSEDVNCSTYNTIFE